MLGLAPSAHEQTYRADWRGRVEYAREDADPSTQAPQWLEATDCTRRFPARHETVARPYAERLVYFGHSFALFLCIICY